MDPDGGRRNARTLPAAAALVPSAGAVHAWYDRAMPALARPMLLAEVDVIVGYFHGATPQFLRGLGVDPEKLPSREAWRGYYARQFALPQDERDSLLLLWEFGGAPIGFSTADKIEPGKQAFMHLHVTAPELRRQGHGVALVRQSAAIYFDTLRIDELYCEPYALNAAPNRTLERAGFAFVMTHECVPGPLNFHQPVNRWVLRRA